MIEGKLVGFDGRKVHHMNERPYGAGFFDELDKSNLLPKLALDRGIELISLEQNWGRGLDPYVLYDRWGHILHQWPEGYQPTWLDVYEVCHQLNLA